MGLDKYSELSDNRIIEKYLETQDSNYFSVLYKRYAGLVYAKSISFLKDENLAKDATQDIFMKVIYKLSKFKGDSKFSTWLYSITYNYCIDVLRRNKNHKKLFTDELETPPDKVDDTPDAVLLEMSVKRLKIVLDNIPPKDKMILLMKYQDDMKIKEIADVLNKTESAIKMKLKRAKHKAKQKYTELFKTENYER